MFIVYIVQLWVCRRGVRKGHWLWLFIIPSIMSCFFFVTDVFLPLSREHACLYDLWWEKTPWLPHQNLTIRKGAIFYFITEVLNTGYYLPEACSVDWLRIKFLAEVQIMHVQCTARNTNTLCDLIVLLQPDENKVWSMHMESKCLENKKSMEESLTVVLEQISLPYHPVTLWVLEWSSSMANVKFLFILQTYFQVALSKWYAKCSCTYYVVAYIHCVYSQYPLFYKINVF